MPRLEAVLFDLDDTLYPERQYVESGFAAVAAWLTKDAPDRSDTIRQLMLTTLERDGRGRVFDAALAILGHDDRLTAMLVHLYRTHIPTLRLFDDVAPTLERLRRQGRGLAIVTDGASAMQAAKVRALDLAVQVDVVVATDDLPGRRSKPDPQGFEIALDRLQVDPAAALYVGDDPAKDFVGARALGLATLHLDRNLAHPLRRSGPWPLDHLADAAAADLKSLAHNIEELEHRR